MDRGFMEHYFDVTFNDATAKNSLKNIVTS